jgi:hypothetical protein
MRRGVKHESRELELRLDDVLNRCIVRTSRGLWLKIKSCPTPLPRFHWPPS